MFNFNFNKSAKALLLMAMCAGTNVANAQNPYLPLWEFIPDGEPYVFDDPDVPGKKRVYVYGSHDNLINYYCGRDQVVWSAPVDDLTNWRYDGIIFESKTDSKGKAKVSLEALSAGVHNTKISYGGDSNFASFEMNLPITTESSTVLEVPDVTKDYGGSEQLQITLTESGSPVANAKVNININKNDYTRTTDANGKASMPINLNAGTYDATVTYKDISTTAKVIINKLNTKNTLSYNKNSHNSFTLTALIDPSTASGSVVFTVNGKDYSAKVNGGKATYTLNNLAVGLYSAVAKYNGDVNHKESSSSSSYY